MVVSKTVHWQANDHRPTTNDFMRLRLKTKLVMAISAMVVALVATLSYIYVSQMLRQRVSEAYASGRSEERRVGKECGYQCRSRWSPYH